MNISLTPEQEAWLRNLAVHGEVSVEDAVRQLIDERMSEVEGDLAWAVPLVQEARLSVARGDVLTLDEHKARNDARLGKSHN